VVKAPKSQVDWIRWADRWAALIRGVKMLIVIGWSCTKWLIYCRSGWSSKFDWLRRNVLPNKVLPQVSQVCIYTVCTPFKNQRIIVSGWSADLIQRWSHSAMSRVLRSCLQAHHADLMVDAKCLLITKLQLVTSHRLIIFILIVFQLFNSSGQALASLWDKLGLVCSVTCNEHYIYFVETCYHR